MKKNAFIIITIIVLIIIYITTLGAENNKAQAVNNTGKKSSDLQLIARAINGEARRRKL